MKSLVRSCGKNPPPGTTTTVYFTFLSELTGWPLTKAENAGQAQGDTKVLDQPFDFANAGQNLGYWRELEILVDTGGIIDTLEGEIGGQSTINRANIFVVNDGAAEREFADQVVANQGCYVFMFRTKSKRHIVLGDPDNGVYVESLEGGTGTVPGDRVGFAYTLYCNSGFTAMLYDADTHGIDLTPNPS
ncbi:MAG: hypothetical protein AAFO07_04265 [Bacteroidota bacterium]